MIRQIGKYLVFCTLSIVLLYFSFNEIEWGSFMDKLKSANYNYLLLSIVAAAGAYYVRSLRWKLLLQTIDINASTATLFHSISFGYLGNLAFPRLGEVIRPGTLASLEKVKFGRVLGTIVVERFVDTVVLFFLLIVVIIMNIELFGHFFAYRIFYPFLEIHTTILLVLLLAIIPLLTLIYSLRHHIAKKIRFAKEIFMGIKTIIHLKSPLRFIFYTLCLWCFYWIMGWITFFCLSATSNLTLQDGLFVLVLGSFGLLAPTPGGIGAFHYIIPLGLTIYGINREEGLLYATLTHTGQMIFTLVIGIYSYIWVLIRKNKQRNLKALETFN